MICLIKKMFPPAIKRTLQKIVYNSIKLNWKTKQGIVIKLKSPVDWTLYNDIFVDHEYDEAIKKTLRKKNPSILDLGANVGFFILRIGALANKNHKISVLAVEPDQTNIDALNKQIDNQSSKFKKNIKLKLIKGIVGKKTGTEKNPVFQ